MIQHRTAEGPSAPRPAADLGPDPERGGPALRPPIMLAAPWSRGNLAVRDRAVCTGLSGDSDGRGERGEPPLREPQQAGARAGRGQQPWPCGDGPARRGAAPSPVTPVSAPPEILLFVTLSLTSRGRGRADLTPRRPMPRPARVSRADGPLLAEGPRVLAGRCSLAKDARGTQAGCAGSQDRRYRINTRVLVP